MALPVCMLYQLSNLADLKHPAVSHQSREWAVRRMDDPVGIPTPIGSVTGSVRVEIDDYRFTATTVRSQHDGIVNFLVVIKLELKIPVFPNAISITVPHGISMNVPLPADRDSQPKVTFDQADVLQQSLD